MSINSRNGHIKVKKKSTHNPQNHNNQMQNQRKTESRGSSHCLITSYNAESHPNKCFPGPSLQFWPYQIPRTSQLVSSTFCLRRRTSYQATHENATGKFNRGIFFYLVLLGSVAGQHWIFQLPSCGNLNLQRRITSTSLIYTAQIMNDSHSWDVGLQHKNLGQYCLEQPPSSTILNFWRKSVTNVCN